MPLWRSRLEAGNERATLAIMSSFLHCTVPTLSLRRTLSPCLRLPGLILATALAGQGPGPVIGGFDFARCSSYSVPVGSAYSSLRTLIQSNFSGAVFTSTATLTSSYLATIDVLVIAPGGDRGNGIMVTTSLSQSEQSALLAFVTAGGRAIIMVDNQTFGGGGTQPTSSVNQSFVAPFGLSPTGQLGNPVSATVLQPNIHPVTNGPFGTVASFVTGDPGWFSSLGPNAASLAQFSGGQTALAVIGPRALSPVSGSVVFLSDMNALDNGRLSLAGNTTLALNALWFTITTARYSLFGSGCPGPNGTPAIATPSAPPVVGATLQVSVGNLPAGSLAFGVIGLRSTSLDLAGVGMPSCRLLVTNDSVAVLGNRPTPTSAAWSFVIPASPGFVGLNLYQQVFATDPQANSLGMINSNAGWARVGM